MNLADGIILFIIAASALLSVRRGFAREALSLATWVAAFLVARLFGPGLEIMLKPTIETPSVRIATAFALLFVATLVVGALINHLLGELIRVTGLTSTDRLLGMVFGAVRGMVLIIVLVALGRGLFSNDEWWRESVLIEQFAMMVEWSRTMALAFIHWLLNVEPVK